jgi:hypothetical protein
VVPILDQTAEDVLRRNPGFLTRAKNFPTFFYFGPDLVPLDEVRTDLARLEVQTVHNGSVVRRNTVSHMAFSPEFLVSFHSEVMPLFPGDIIYTDGRATRRGLVLIPPYDHPHVIAGQGTAALELLADTGPLDMLVVPVGGGGLIAGCAVAATGLHPGIRVVGVEPEAGDDHRRSERRSSTVPRTEPGTQHSTAGLLLDGRQLRWCPIRSG